MAEPSSEGRDEGEELARIEAAVREGSTDLSALGFWSVVRRLKADPSLAERWAEQAGRIDREAFERRMRWRFPVWLGNAALLGGVAVGGIAIVLSAAFDDGLLKGLALAASAGILSVSVHCPAHWAVGRAAGLRFVAYYPGGPVKVQPSLKIDYASYLRTPAAARARMHAAGAVASKVAPFVSLVMWPLTGAPLWAGLAVLGLGLLQIVSDVVWSTKHSDWKKFLRERRYAAGPGPAA
jgi:hypothetical protein